ncbi:MAG: serine/threonine protein kinase [Myxococcales bacterium]|nr:serine/threonine protein kinase [Myxococcales bacterium]
MAVCDSTTKVVDGNEKLEAGVILHETYVLKTLLGTGGMGAVWKAQHVRLPRQMAVKVLHEQGYQNVEIIQRFRREAEITSRLGHPHIVEVFDFNVLPDGRAYLVMELLRGASLRDHLREGCSLDPGWIMLVLDQITSALEHAHSAGIVHRDLKPENIFMVDQSGAVPHAKVLDFGISKIQGAQTVLTQGGGLLGTPRYMSPEQARGDSAEVDGRADQFSVGTIAYEMFSGYPAFTGTSVTEVLIKVLQEDPVPLAAAKLEVPPALLGVVMRALSKDADARFRDMTSFRAELKLAWGQSLPSLLGSPVELGPLNAKKALAGEDTVIRTDDVIGRNNRPTASEPLSSRLMLVSQRRTLISVWGIAAVILIVGLGLALLVAEQMSRDPVTVRSLLPNSIPTVRTPSQMGYETLTATTSVRSDLSTSSSIQPTAASSEVERPEEGSPNRRTRRPIRPRPLPIRLVGAKVALRKKDYDEAIRLARRGLRETSDARAFGLLTIAYCGKKDLGSARARLRQTPQADRAQVMRKCAELGLDF